MNRRQTLAVLGALGHSPVHVLAATAEPRAETFQYVSTVDQTGPLIADAVFLPDGKKKPLLAVMHGFSGDRTAVTADAKQLAARGVFAVAPDMRGRGKSAGKFDSGGLDTHDIVDAIREVIRKYPAEVDPTRISVVGYSGGGGNAVFCGARFPDFFQCCISFFGVVDYGGWHRSKGRPDCNMKMEAALGGTPEQLPHVYAARNAIPAAANARGTRFHFFWDEEEVMCPADMIEEFVEARRTAGLRNTHTHISRKLDPVRWKHGYRTGVPDLVRGDDLFLPDVMSQGGASLELPRSGRLVVPGYLVTRRFSVWIGDGQQGRCEISYAQGDPGTQIRVLSNPSGIPIRTSMLNG